LCSVFFFYFFFSLVHRFTHRVVRGVLILAGRPDGRLCCLAKSEASLLLSLKQAAFIRNPDYQYLLPTWLLEFGRKMLGKKYGEKLISSVELGGGNGPEIVTIGHNPYTPNLGGNSKDILLDNIQNHYLPHYSTHHLSVHGANSNVINIKGRRKFVDEYLYDRLFLAQKPFTLSILRSLRRSMELGARSVQLPLTGEVSNRVPTVDTRSAVLIARQRSNSLNTSSHYLYRPTGAPSQGQLGPVAATSHPHVVTSSSSAAVPANQNKKRTSSVPFPFLQLSEPLPYGIHHIDPQLLINATSSNLSVFADFIAANADLLLHPSKINNNKIQKLKQKSTDPNVKVAFSSKLDNTTRQIQDLQVIVQQFYECRIASLERYISYCVMFHAMAVACHKPWLMFPWDIARSQSNLRVATTGKKIIFLFFFVYFV
jgi:hypothetical protein